MALGYRIEAVSIIGTEVMQPRGLTGLAFDTLASSTMEIFSVFRLLADEKNYPVMIHCTQGKDRTGLIVLLLLSMLEVPVAAIAADYRASERELEVEMEERLDELRKGGLEADFARCPTGFVEAVVAEIENKYGGIERYLNEKVGVDEGMQRKIRSIMLHQ
ncbi:MAG: hypothetical protein HETSPECPRED_005587 [Heterodermia speciosa]|uniref:Tyrosine specific protein phosphatases domain-containing protein n=1 Tax=Heterodermia speciosa TaxID=116794 RepID=A0A8H3ISJ8_9LECA|nr:MAG: hypothetical protein HETSPECPRED_005587 [Heterodermia speciosa]